MDIDDFAAPEVWAEQQWGGADLGDTRRRARAVRLGAALAARPDVRLPAQADTGGDLKAAYPIAMRLSSGESTRKEGKTPCHSLP